MNPAATHLSGRPAGHPDRAPRTRPAPVSPAALVPILLILAGAGNQEAPVRYTAGQLDCARFAETSRGELATETGGRTRRERIERDGIWIVAARDSAGAIAVESWYDSLGVSRTGPEGSLVPDTDGLLGGRYRGLLSPDGVYRPGDRPFVPDEVAEVMDLRRAFDDLLPRLPGAEIRPGERWTDSAGWTVERLPDSLAAGDTLRRYRTEVDRPERAIAMAFDTVAVEARESSRERGGFVWHPARGLLFREREIVVETTVPAGGPVRRPVRSRLEQHITIRRLPPAEARACAPVP